MNHAQRGFEPRWARTSDRYQLSAFSSQQHNSSVSSSVIHPSRFISSQPSFEPVFAENQERHENGRLLISR
jgi:hypothetical protein